MDTTIEAVDLLYGVPAISAATGLTEAAIYHLHKRDDFPTFKIGGKVCARRSTLNAWLAEQEAKAKS